MKRGKIIATVVLIMLQLCNTLSTFATTEDEGEAKWQSHFPDDAELAVPYPLYEPNEILDLIANVPEGVNVNVPENPIVSYDTQTEEEMVLDFSVKEIAPEAWIPGLEVESETSEGQFELMNFTGLGWVPGQDYPWSPNCKIYYRRNCVWYVGSGVLIDAYHVLCAGHIVHAGCGGAWSSDVVVVPGYHQGSRPYGDANKVTLYSWQDWTVRGDLNHDIGLIRLDRPVGAITGCHGFGYNTNPSFYTQSCWNNPGYPAESPYSGQNMYDWNGTFDWTTGLRAAVNRRGVGGQDGSGAYTKICGTRYVFAVFSHRGTGFLHNCTFFPVLTASKCDHIASIINGYTPSSFDLHALNVKVSPSTVREGQRLSSMSYLVYNHSKASWSGTVYVDVYLSRNSDISRADMWIGRHYFKTTFSPRERLHITLSNPPTIPCGTSGDYYIGVILDVQDSNTNNNDSDGQEAAPIRVGW